MYYNRTLLRCRLISGWAAEQHTLAQSPNWQFRVPARKACEKTYPLLACILQSLLQPATTVMCNGSMQNTCSQHGVCMRTCGDPAAFSTVDVAQQVRSQLC